MRRLALGFSGLFRWRSVVYCPRYGSVRVRGHMNHGYGLKRYMYKDCGRTFNDKIERIFHYFRLKLIGVVHAYSTILGLA